MIRSLFKHCSSIWRPTNQTTMNKLESLQKRALKWVLNEEYCSYSNFDYLVRCRQLRILPLKQKFDLNDLVFIHKIVHGLSPAKLPEHITLYNPAHTRSLRSGHLDQMSLVSSVQPQVHRTYDKVSVNGSSFKTFENSFFYRTHALWNKLPLETRSLHIPSVFKQNASKFLWQDALECVITEHSENNVPLKFNLTSFLPPENIQYTALWDAG